MLFQFIYIYIYCNFVQTHQNHLQNCEKGHLTSQWCKVRALALKSQIMRDWALSLYMGRCLLLVLAECYVLGFAPYPKLFRNQIFVQTLLLWINTKGQFTTMATFSKLVLTVTGWRSLVVSCPRSVIFSHVNYPVMNCPVANCQCS